MIKEGIALAFVALVVFIAPTSALPEDLIGFDTPYERCLMYQDMYEDKLDLLASSELQGTQIRAYEDFYYNYYNELCMKYARMYWWVYDLGSA